MDPLQLQTQFGAQLGVERRQRLVHEVDRRIAHQRPPDRDPLHFAAGKPRRPVAELAADVQQFRRLLNALANCRFRDAAGRRAQRKGEIVVDGQVGIQRILLKDERDIPRPRRVARHVVAVDRNRTVVGALKARNQPKRRRLAGAARPQQHDELAIVDGQRQVAHRFDAAKTLVDVAQDDVSHRLRSHRPPSGSPSRSAHRTTPADRAGTRGPPSHRPRPARSTAAAP